MTTTSTFTGLDAFIGRRFKRKGLMRWKFFMVAIVLVIACGTPPPKSDSSDDERLTEQLLEVPNGFPPIPFPEDNAFNLDKWKLGKALFYDQRLSADQSISCGSCHKMNAALADQAPISPGVSGRLGDRNAPSLANVAYQPYFMREGSVPNLERQVLVPIQDHNEMSSNIVEVVDRLKGDTLYQRLSQRAFQRNVDAFVVTRAIATFERTFISGNSKYDQSKRGELQLSETEARGEELFFSERTSCSSCHGGFNFSHYGLENTGWYNTYTDAGRFRLTQDSADLGRFKVPSLRNVGLTAPYLHNGSVTDLSTIVEHYNRGDRIHQNQSPLIRPLGLSQQEVEDIVAFLHTLSDASFCANPNLAPAP
jgi:cytochrome c peroxidase